MRVAQRVVDARRLRQPREQGRLRHRELRRALREVGLRRGLDAVGLVAVEDLVHVGGEDPLLRPALLELHREAGLLQLARDRALLVADVERPRQLLGEGRRALHRLAALQVGERGADDADVVEGAVLVEAAVLDRDRRLGQPRRHLAQRQALAVLLRGDTPISVPRDEVTNEFEPSAIGFSDDRVQLCAISAGLRRRRGSSRRRRRRPGRAAPPAGCGSAAAAAAGRLRWRRRFRTRSSARSRSRRLSGSRPTEAECPYRRKLRIAVRSSCGWRASRAGQDRSPPPRPRSRLAIPTVVASGAHHRPPPAGSSPAGASAQGRLQAWCDR